MHHKQYVKIKMYMGNTLFQAGWLLKAAMAQTNRLKCTCHTDKSHQHRGQGMIIQYVAA